VADEVKMGREADPAMLDHLRLDDGDPAGRRLKLVQ